MANTVIQIKSSGAVGNVPASLLPGELAINYEDGKLYYGDASSQVELFDVITEPAGLDGEIQFNNLGSFGSDSQLSFNDTTKVLTVGSVSTGGLNVAPAIQSAYDTANSAAIVSAAAFNDSNTRVSKSGDAMSGSLSTTGNTWADVVYANTELYVGVATYAATLLPNTLAQFTGNTTQYTQVNQQNINEGGSGDFVVTADVGNDTNFYIDMGINNSQFDDPESTVYQPLDGYLVVKGSDIDQLGGNLIIGTVSTEIPGEIRIVAGGSNTENIVAKFNTAGAEVLGTLNVDGEITSPTTTRISIHANSSFNQANLAFNSSNSASQLAQAAFDAANTSSGTSGSNYFPTSTDWGNLTDPILGGLSYEIIAQVYDCRDEPIIPQGYDLEIDFGYLT